MLDRFKGFWQGVMLAPFVRLFIRLGISPDVVTLVGTLGVVGAGQLDRVTGVAEVLEECRRQQVGEDDEALALEGAEPYFA